MVNSDNLHLKILSEFSERTSDGYAMRIIFVVRTAQRFSLNLSNYNQRQAPFHLKGKLTHIADISALRKESRWQCG